MGLLGDLMGGVLMVHETLNGRLQWMRRILGRLVAFALVPGIAFAQDLPPPETPSPRVGFPIQQFAIDGSAVATSLGGRSVDFNATFAPFGDINDTGFRARLSGNASWYRFVTGDNPTTIGSGHSLEGGVLAGYQWSLPRISFIGLIGPTFTENYGSGVKSGQWGAKTVLSAYALPSDGTMAFGSISYSTVANFLQVQAKAGMRFVGNFYVGPETIFSWRNVVPGINNVAELRLGGHISAVSFGPVQMSVSGGWAHQQSLGSGYYGGVNFYLTY
jgi:Cellulose biosynthesis protein BcsS